MTEGDANRACEDNTDLEEDGGSIEISDWLGDRLGFETGSLYSLATNSQPSARASLVLRV